MRLVVQLQKYIRRRLRKKVLKTKVRILASFKAKLLAIYKGWFVRKKVFKNKKVVALVGMVSKVRKKYDKQKKQVKPNDIQNKTSNYEYCQKLKEDLHCQIL
mmetsp:Transcript_1212/g.1255  ORF Transcript_1212/g.1255 Transcript_1212/m.1255 type:complete len:102 (-) Transcript_1212:923-1228(-)|eukprot:CAMPEP_0170546378 /NCGR_PEP_ID=MMETSP0211-20121228/4738_1 /TAXON_ID=311385 /ORGANISM="Pseudokeronopsis sp., Strain OXSARD2" /LENGTH=101 /DNA_ID=CAMNT_0010850823 /DNA_START=942 /DNA_END=1247 /DNA_ORIENTATION=-